jgi:hypothetical protein
MWVELVVVYLRYRPITFLERPLSSNHRPGDLTQALPEYSENP